MKQFSKELQLELNVNVINIEKVSLQYEMVFYLKEDVLNLGDIINGK
ncbi:hypothetical protein [Peribacillus simplex]